MAIHVAWYNAERQSVSYIFEGGWDWEELYDAFRQARSLERSVGHKVDVIIEMEEGTTPGFCLHNGYYVANNAFIYALIQQHLH